MWTALTINSFHDNNLVSGVVLISLDTLHEQQAEILALPEIWLLTLIISQCTVARNFIGEGVTLKLKLNLVMFDVRLSVHC